jgi:putative RNA 2'-phosphotransferase
MLSKENSKQLSKLMTKMLRHDPSAFGIALDPGDGSTEAEELLRAIRRLDGWEAPTMEQIRLCGRE